MQKKSRLNFMKLNKKKNKIKIRLNPVGKIG